MNITSIGAIPVGLKLKFNGYPLFVKAQYNLDGKVVLQLWDEDGNQKASIINTSDVDPVTNIIASQALKNIERDSKEYKSQRMVIKNMMKNLAGEVVDHNKKSKLSTPKPAAKRPAMKKPAAKKPAAKKPTAKKPTSPAVNCSTFGSELRTKKTSAAGRGLVKLCRWDKKK